MPLTQAQLTQLKNDIAADGTLNQKPHNSDGATDVAIAYNAVATPDYWVRRTSVTKDEYVNSTSQDNTTFTYVGNGMISRSTGEQFAWADMFDNPQGAVNPSRPQVFQAFTDIFSGTGNAAANLTHLRAVSRRKASRVEKLFAGAPGIGTTANPATMTFEGPLQYSDVMQAWEQG